MWTHVGVQSVKLTSVNGTGVIGYGEALKGPRIWNAQTIEQLAEKRGAGFSQVTMGARGLKGIGEELPGAGVARRDCLDGCVHHHCRSRRYYYRK